MALNNITTSCPPSAPGYKPTLAIVACDDIQLFPKTEYELAPLPANKTAAKKKTLGENFTLVAGEVFSTVKGRLNTVKGRHAKSGEGSSSGVEHGVEIQFDEDDVNTRYFIDQVLETERCGCGVVIAASRREGGYDIYGTEQFPLMLSHEATSGDKFGGEAKNTKFTFVGVGPVTPTILPATFILPI